MNLTASLALAATLFFLPLAWMLVDSIGGMRSKHSAAIGVGSYSEEDFAGRPWTELFNAGFRRDHPLRTIRSWGTLRKEGTPRPSPVDGKLLNELRSLGYIR